MARAKRRNSDRYGYRYQRSNRQFLRHPSLPQRLLSFTLRRTALISNQDPSKPPCPPQDCPPPCFRSWEGGGWYFSANTVVCTPPTITTLQVHVFPEPQKCKSSSKKHAFPGGLPTVGAEFLLCFWLTKLRITSWASKRHFLRKSQKCHLFSDSW